MKRTFKNTFNYVHTMKSKILPVLLALFIVLNINTVFAFEESENIINIPIIGEINLADKSIIISTILIASADGLNPCSIWVLLFLLGMILHTGSRRKILLVGSLFLLTTAFIYGAFIATIFTIFTFMNHISWLVYTIAILALIFGIVNVKDYFWFKKGISFTISDKHKPKLYKKARNLIKEESTVLLAIATIFMAAGIAIIELPCTAGLPLVWTNIVQASDIEVPFFILLGLYILMYLLIEIIILATVLITLKSIKMDEFKGRALKLFGGLLIIALALVLLIDKTIMYNLNQAMSIILGTILLSILIITTEYLWKKRKNDKTAK